MNDKGFTLIEVLGVFTVLAIIMMISLPMITKTLKNNDTSKYDEFKESVAMAAETYYENNRELYESSMTGTGSKISITVGTLKSEGLISDIPTKPNGSTITDSMVVEAVMQADGTIIYTFKG